MFVLIFSEPIYRYWFVRQTHDYIKEKRHLDSLMATWNWEDENKASPTSTKTEASVLFAFDPNQCSRQELIDLGFSKPLTDRVINYRSKGGRFLVKKDLMKIYGMDSSYYLRLIPFINLPDFSTKEKPFQKLEIKEKSAFVKFDLNKADTSQLIRIYGIGSKLAGRIITFRERLGGFISESQLNEVYGLDSIVVRELASKSFIEVAFQPKQININSATEKELGAHPYIKYKLAKAIVAYRMQHGFFASVDGLRGIAILDEKAFARMKPYITNR
jgi:DNA uptake protein ComE-like DNA-binding protein